MGRPSVGKKKRNNIKCGRGASLCLAQAHIETETAVNRLENGHYLDPGVSALLLAANLGKAVAERKVKKVESERTYPRGS